MPLVSVILPNYNHAQFLKQRIESILNQTFQDFELIILDDYSSDNSRDVIEEYLSSEKIAQVIFNEKNSGSTFLQWKKGFALAKGEYIWIAESDDYADPTFLEKLIPLLEKNKNCTVAYSFSYLVNDKGEMLSEDWDKSKNIHYKDKIFDGKSFVKGWMLLNNSIYNASMAIFRRSVLNSIDDEYSKYRYNGDWLFWNKICLQGDVIRYCEKLNYFRQHTQKVTSKADAEGLGFIEAKYVIDDMFKSLKLSSIQKTVVTGWFMKRIVSSKYYKSDTIKKNILNDVKSFFKCNLSSIYIYKLDKRFNFSSLNIKKNRYT